MKSLHFAHSILFLILYSLQWHGSLFHFLFYSTTNAVLQKDHISLISESFIRDPICYKKKSNSSQGCCEDVETTAQLWRTSRPYHWVHSTEGGMEMSFQTKDQRWSCCLFTSISTQIISIININTIITSHHQGGSHESEQGSSETSFFIHEDHQGHQG